MSNRELTLAFLRLTAKHELGRDEFFRWRVDGDTVAFFYSCDDLFEPGVAGKDGWVEITPENFPLLEKTFDDLAAIDDSHCNFFRHCYGPELFAVRLTGKQARIGWEYDYRKEQTAKVAALFEEAVRDKQT